MHRSLCVCALIPRIETRTRLLLVMHRIEDRKTTNTGRLAAECLVHSEVIVRGHTAEATEPLRIAPGSRPVLLFPAEDAVPLSLLAPSLGPDVTLIVPDGTWRQASKVRRRVPGMGDIPCVTLASSAGVPASSERPSSYRLRAEAHAHGLATLEAIARAMGILEGPHVEEALEIPFRAMVERTLWARGALAARDVTSGIPEGVRRHDPESGAGVASARVVR